MKSNMWKSTFREIKQSFGRFMAIFAIIALGVSLFSGLKVLQPAMVKTTDTYLKEKQFYNYRLLSTLGFEQEDVDFLASKEDVRAIEGAVSFDILCMQGNENTFVLKAYNLPENINDVELLSGRMPEKENECLVDSAVFTEEKLGEKIILSLDNEEDDLENFAYREYTITGIAQSPNYIQTERGTTSLGNGKITGFVYIPLDGFDVDYFTEILLKFDEDDVIFSDEYEAYMDAKKAEWEMFAQEAADLRYERIVVKAEEELADAKKEFEEEKADAEKDLEEARIELANAKAELLDGDRKLAEGKKELADGKQKIIDGRKELETNREKLVDAQEELAEGEKELEKGFTELEENQKLLEKNEAELAVGLLQLEEGQMQLNEQSAILTAAAEELTSAHNAIDTLQVQLETYKPQLAFMTPEQQEALLIPLEQAVDQVLIGLSQDQTSMDQETEQTGLTVDQRVLVLEEKLAVAKEKVVAQETTVAQGKEQIASAQAEIDKNKAELEAGVQQLAAGKEQLDSGKAQLEAAQRDLKTGKKELQKGLEAISDAEKELADAEAEVLDGEAELKKNEQKLADGWKEYYDGLEEYEEGYAEFLTEIADAEAEIADAEAEIADIEKPETFVLGRETNVGYVCFENDSAIVDGIANVFPVFFYAVAALVCITTMNRMVEEQRTQIGVLKALGYSQASIMGKYLFYSGSAAISGCIVGYFFGTWLFPLVIWFAYGSMYDVAPIIYVFDAGILAFSLLVSIACSMGTTYLTCRRELSEVAAELMRPKAPKAGKRVFLERIPFVWKRMKFLHKVSYRNVFRYKKRFFMMVIGISGCTGLVLTGFGVQDSIANIANDQYDRIQVYDINVMLTDEVTEDTDELINNIAGDQIREYIYVMEKTMDLTTDDAVKGVSLVAIDEKNEIAPYVSLPDVNGDILEFPGLGECILTDKLARTFELKVGDVITLTDENNHSMELTLAGIAENYLSNFVYMTTQTYEKAKGEPAEVKSIYLNIKDKNLAHQVTADLMKEEEVASAMVSSDSKNRFTSMIESLDLLVVVVIVCAAFLAFIVLYNLTNINITERIREIATIKVLGFYKNETASYIFRENLILTFIGALVGLGLGKLFHAFVMSQVQVDQVSFAVRILPISYLYSVLITFVFAFVVNLFMGKKLDRVSMTESLKSVD